MADYDVFISHKVEDRPIATELKKALEHLSKFKMKIHVCEEIPGGADWRNWIEDKIAGSTILLFLYTDIEADWRWCLYELGMFRGKNKSQERSTESRIVCIKNPDIPTLPSPIENIQAYNADKDGIEQFFDVLLSKGKCLNDELYTKMKEHFDEYVKKVVKFFTPPMKTEFFVRRIAITLSTVSGEEIQEAKLEEAGISGNAGTMSFLRLPETSAQWSHLYSSFKEKGQSAWLDQLCESIDQIRSRGCPIEVMRPFKSPDGDAFIPVVSRVETFRLRDENKTIIPKQLFVVFVPMPEEYEASSMLRELQDLPYKWITYAPSSVIRVEWERKSGEQEYLEGDRVGEPVVCAFNRSFAELFDFNYEAFQGRPLTLEWLFGRIKDYVLEEHMTKLMEDQQRVSKRIIYEDSDDMAKVPLQFNDRHRKFPNEAYLPYLICKHLVGEVDGRHETYFLICYIRDFWPLDHPKSS